MSVKEFISSVKDYLGLDKFQKSSKKKSVKNLLKKLYNREEAILKSLKKKLKKKEKKELKEELDIISVQIKNGKKIQEKLKG